MLLVIRVFLLCVFCIIRIGVCDALEQKSEEAEEKIASDRELFEGKTILVLGGTGFLGREIIRSCLEHNPKKVIAFSRDEFKQFNLENFFHNNPKLHCVLGDIRNYESVLEATKGVDIVFHTAALKRIDVLEKNVEEAIKTNILGSLNVFKACVANKVKKAVFVSTDKACLPINVYGACKFVSEKIFTNYDPLAFETQFIVVRYGNVLESTGSIVPILLDKITKKESISLTDPQMTRFIMSKQESIELIIDALRYGRGGEIFVKVPPSMRIVDLIDVMKAKLHAHNSVKITGLRPGEKINEMLVNSAEMSRSILFKDYYIIGSSMSDPWRQPLPFYARKGKPASEGAYQQLSSEQTVLSKEALSTYLEGKMR